MCESKQRFVFLSLLFLSLSLSVFSLDGSSQASEVESSEPSLQYVPANPSEMTDAEIIAELMASLERREKSIEQREASILTRKTDLTARERSLTERNGLLDLRSRILSESENYWKNYKKDALKNEIIIGASSFGVGLIVGLVLAR